MLGIHWRRVWIRERVNEEYVWHRFLKFGSTVHKLWRLNEE